MKKNENPEPKTSMFQKLFENRESVHFRSIENLNFTVVGTWS
ncbi:hypothetical protein LEP1GSC158_0124 [Leptospira interrogans serovar Zanoni str. LT2156]|uniref:Uncharacterized protein n=1 Tax=Leptospira interrogans serovar Zanoni str. LT2156 TaxID=1001601 RepID=M6HH05_LEPIR|nr:hypothetical protein LEP1GSC158_0124 [Leptospira interrogans serovar Zanoni str. LT2156]